MNYLVLCVFDLRDANRDDYKYAYTWISPRSACAGR